MKTLLIITLLVSGSIRSSLAGGIEKTEKHADKEFTMKVPSDWRRLSVGGRFSLFLQGDGIQLPATDAGSPLQAGLTVERFENIQESVTDGARKLAEASKRAPGFEPEGEPTITELKLSDGGAAALLTVQGLKDGARSSLQMKMLVKAKGDVGFVVSGFLVGAKGSKVAVSTSPEAKALLDCMKSFQIAIPAESTNAGQGGADQPAAAPESKPEGSEKSKPESEGRPR